MTMDRTISLADLAVTVIGDLNSLLDGVNNDHPQRALLRQLAAAAQKAAHDGLRTAAEIAEATQRLREHLEQPDGHNRLVQFDALKHFTPAPMPMRDDVDVTAQAHAAKIAHALELIGKAQISGPQMGPDWLLARLGAISNALSPGGK